jgi:hypothetical protein
MNTRFSEHVTSTAFHLSLSKRMINVLAAIHQLSDKGYRKVLAPSERVWSSHWVPTARSLSERGLVVHEDPSQQNPPWSRYPYQLTKAGQLVLELLKEADLLREVSLIDSEAPYGRAA